VLLVLVLPPPLQSRSGLLLPTGFTLQVGNTNKQKWLHALSLTAAMEMTPEQLTVVPEGSTKSPYEGGSRKRGAEAMEDDERLGAQDWRWQQRGGKRQQQGQQAPIAAPSLGEGVRLRILLLLG
jgi:hypothetical protein